MSSSRPTRLGSDFMNQMCATGLASSMWPTPVVTGEEKLRGKVNYLIGNDPDQWRTHIPTYAKVRYQEVYPGIDLVYYRSEGQLEYDYLISPGADPNAIRMTFGGVDGMDLEDCPRTA